MIDLFSFLLGDPGVLAIERITFDNPNRIVYTGRQLADCHCRPF
jgi:hypothetical protein